MNNDHLIEIAKQLSHPAGEAGIRTADQMHSSNIGMTRTTITDLDLVADDSVLELGHGNGKHIIEILAHHESIRYTGLEISELMSAEAHKAIPKENTSFAIYDGLNIPFETNYFSKIMTVNTLYFWKNPPHLLDEVYRVLQPGGKFCCTFAEKDFMEKLPFTKFIFELYDRNKVTKLFQGTSFRTIKFKEYTEELSNKEGQSIERKYTIAILEK
jgi:ubiquinone/menaquinone biosynthesis C-methylase UbiE